MKPIIFIILLLTSVSIIYITSKILKKPPPKPTCKPGRAGNDCQYSDEDNCNGRGKVFINEKGEPQCKCAENFDGQNCELCNTKDGFGGNNCEFNNKIHCKGRGRVVSDKNNKPICIQCEFPFDGSNCEKCKPGYAGSNCQYNDSYCRPNDNVEIRGIVIADSNDKPKCICNTGYFGNKCQYETSSRCNHNGSYDAETNTCNCNTDEGYRGKTCKFRDSIECGIGGRIYDIDESDPLNPKITCKCFNKIDEERSTETISIIESGYGGSKCQFKVSDICKGRGKLKVEKTQVLGKEEEVVKCIDCIGNFEGDYCDECKKGFYGKEYNCEYSDKICNEGGLINLQGNEYKCICNPGNPRTKEGKRSGSKCQFLDKDLCNNRGIVDKILNEKSNPVSVKCICDDEKYTGDRCQFCAPGRKGENCEYIDTICNGNGILNENGSCICASEYTGNRCQLCKDTYNGKPQTSLIYNNKLFCVTNDFCNGRGVPVQILPDGTVKCSYCTPPYKGDKCEKI